MHTLLGFLCIFHRRSDEFSVLHKITRNYSIILNPHTVSPASGCLRIRAVASANGVIWCLVYFRCTHPLITSRIGRVDSVLCRMRGQRLSRS